MPNSEQVITWIDGRLRVLVASAMLVLAVTVLEEFFFMATLMAHLRLHLSVLLIILGLILLLARNWKWGAFAGSVGGMTLIACMVTVFTPVAFPKKDAPAGEKLRVFCHNVNAANARLEEILAEVDRLDPDIVLLLEVTGEMEILLLELEEEYPWNLIESESGNFGIAFYSRIPMVKGTIRDFSGYEVNSTVANLDLNGQEIRLIGTHPVPPVGGWHRRVQAWHLKDLTRISEDTTVPLVVAGDFNLTPWSAGYQKYARKSQLRRVAPAFRSTWQLSPIPGTNLPIDHIFVSEEWFVQSFEVGELIGSDHRWIMADLILPTAPATAP